MLITAAMLLLAAGCNTANQTSAPAPTNNNQSDATPPAQTTPPEITPPQTQSNNVFIDSSRKISLDYSGLSMQAETPGSYIPPQNNFSGEIPNLLTLYLNPSIYKGTNLESGWFNLATAPYKNADACYDRVATENKRFYNQARKVQGNTWYYGLPNPQGSAAAGHSALVETYRLYKDNTCYEVALGLSGFNRQNLENPETVKEYDAKKMANYLGAVFNRLQIQ